MSVRCFSGATVRQIKQGWCGAYTHMCFFRDSCHLWFSCSWKRLTQPWGFFCNKTFPKVSGSMALNKSFKVVKLKATFFKCPRTISCLTNIRVSTQGREFLVEHWQSLAQHPHNSLEEISKSSLPGEESQTLSRGWWLDYWGYSGPWSSSDSPPSATWW